MPVTLMIVASVERNKSLRKLIMISVKLLSH